MTMFKLVRRIQKYLLIASAVALVALLLLLVAINVATGAYSNLLWAALGFALGFTLIIASVFQVSERMPLALAMMGVGLLILCFLPMVVLAQGAPVITLSVDDRVPEVGQEVTVSWTASGADSVSVRRNGVQVRTLHTGQLAETVADRKPVAWAITASNRNGSDSAELTVKAARFGSPLSFLRGSNPAGDWVTQIILSLIPACVIIGLAIWKGNITPGPFIAGGISIPAVAFLCRVGGLGSYWLVTALVVMLVLAIVGWVMLSD